MPSIKIPLIFLIFIIVVSCTDSAIKISDDFDHGSIGKLQEIEPGYFQGSTRHWLKRDGIGDQYYWFYFKADNFKGQKLTFELDNLQGIYRRKPHLIYSDHTQPVFSYDQVTWKRIETVSYDSASHTITFSEDFNRSPVWIAYAHPYPLQRLESFISSIRKNEYVTVEELARTKEGRGIELVTITDSQIASEDKKTIFLMAMQHAGEDAGTFYLEGLINFLLSDDEDALSARENFIYKLIPMMNPDGVYNGTTRYNIEMEDLNNIWLDEEKMQPEVLAVKNWVSRWYEGGNSIDLVLDIHNHTQFFTYNVFIFIDHDLDGMVSSMEKFWPTRLWHAALEGTSCAFFKSQGIPCGAVELTQSFAERGDYLDFSDYHHYGAGTVRGLTDYFGTPH